MFCSLRLVPFVFLLLLAGCKSQAPSRAIERLAVLPLENLTGDRAFDWLSRGAQVALNRQLTPSRTVAVSPHAGSADATVSRATRLLHTTLEKRGGQLRLEAVIEDALTHRQIGERIVLQQPPEQILAGLNQLAQGLAKDAAPPPTSTPAALEAYVASQTASQPEARAAALTQAAGLDPQFALPLMNLAELYLAAGQRDPALAALTALGSRQLNAVEREQVALLKANLTQDRPQQSAALQKLALAAPSQENVQVFAANLLKSLHQLGPATAAYERAARVDPDNPEIWNSLAYARAYLGQLPAAREALEAYRKLDPNDANALDSLGEVHYLNGQFKAAADYFQACFAKSPQFKDGRALLKAAYARLLDDQLGPAQQAEAQYLKLAAGAPAAIVAHAHWLNTISRPQEAVAYLAEAAAKATGPLAAVYQTHRCGLLLRYDRAEAQAAARAAMAAGPAGPAVLCFFLSQPSASPAEWSARAARSFAAPNSQAFGRQALAYALFFDGHFADAFPLIETLAQETSPDADSEIRVWLAESHWRTGRWSSARETVARWPLPASESIFAGHHLPDQVLAILKTGEHYDDNAISKRWSPIGKLVLRPTD